jgi:hypothetical protein
MRVRRHRPCLVSRNVFSLVYSWEGFYLLLLIDGIYDYAEVDALETRSGRGPRRLLGR